MSILRGVEKSEVDTWCAQFGFMFAKYKFKVVYPSINMIENVGFGDFATHTKSQNNTNKIVNLKLNYKNLKESYEKSFDHERFNIECPSIYNRLKKLCRKYLKII